MKTRTKTIGASIVILAISAFAANADPAECRQAIHEYNSAMAEVSDALRHYARCISDSQGHDDCSTEFSSLKSAQDDFESAVSDYESECP
jgi:hypothetical protein